MTEKEKKFKETIVSMAKSYGRKTFILGLVVGFLAALILI